MGFGGDGLLGFVWEVTELSVISQAQCDAMGGNTYIIQWVTMFCNV